MKRVLAGLLLVSLMLAGCGAAPPVSTGTPPPVNKDWTITGTWFYDFTNYMGCSPTITAGCISGFTWGYMNGTMLVPIATLSEPIPACSATVTENCQVTSTTQPVTIKFQGNSQLPIGNISFGVEAADISQQGATQQSPIDVSATATPVVAGAPTNISITSVQ